MTPDQCTGKSYADFQKERITMTDHSELKKTSRCLADCTEWGYVMALRITSELGTLAVRQAICATNDEPRLMMNIALRLALLNSDLAPRALNDAKLRVAWPTDLTESSHPVYPGLKPGDIAGRSTSALIAWLIDEAWELDASHSAGDADASADECLDVLGLVSVLVQRLQINATHVAAWKLKQQNRDRAPLPIDEVLPPLAVDIMHAKRKENNSNV